MSVVTGVGLVSPFGVGVECALAGIARGEQCARLHTLGTLEIMAALVPTLDATSERLRSEYRPAEAFLRSAIAQAVTDAGIDPAGVPLFVGTCSGEMQRFEHGLEPSDWYEQPGQGAARAFGLGHVTTFTSACTSSIAALAAAHTALAAGRIERAIVAGTDATCRFAASGFVTLKAASQSPAMPFAKARTGLNFGEGAAAIVLERRSARGKARVDGVALSSDAKHATAPRADALGLQRCTQQALARAGDPAIDVYVSHGTATIANDAMELTLGARMHWLGKPWLAHKAFLGHAMGASGLMSFVLASEQMRRGARVSVPYGDLEDGVCLNASLEGARRALLVAAAFGGSNAALVWENI